MIQATTNLAGIGASLRRRAFSLANTTRTVTRRSFAASTSSSTSSSSWTDEAYRPKKALVLGSSGALGSHVARHLSKDLNMQVLGADVMELPPELTEDFELDGFVAIDKDYPDLATLTTTLVRGVHSFVKKENDDEGEGLDAIICASGGWQGDPPDVTPADGKTLTEEEIVRGAENYATTIDTMMRMNTDPVLAAGYVAQHYMNVTGGAGGLMVVIGATAALSPTPGMFGYGLSKTAAHYLVRTLGACTESTMESKSIRKAGRSVRRKLPALDRLHITAILPTTLDTPANRKQAMDADTSQWIKPQDISFQIGEWIRTPALRPHSGSLFKVYPTNDGGGSGGSGVGFELVL